MDRCRLAREISDLVRDSNAAIQKLWNGKMAGLHRSRVRPEESLRGSCEYCIVGRIASVYFQIFGDLNSSQVGFKAFPKEG